MYKITLKIIGSIVLLFSTHLIAATTTNTPKTPANNSYFSMQNLQTSVGNIKNSDLVFRVGRYIKKYNFSVEVRSGFGLNEGSATKDSKKITYKTNILLGGYLKKHIKIDRKGLSTLYGIVGYTLLTYSYTEKDGTNTKSITSGDTSASWGIGLDTRVTDNSYINLEYIQYNSNINKINESLDGFSVGVTVDF